MNVMQDSPVGSDMRATRVASWKVKTPASGGHALVCREAVQRSKPAATARHPCCRSTTLPPGAPSRSEPSNRAWTPCNMALGFGTPRNRRG